MVYVDDGLLTKLVDKYGVEKVHGTANKSKLWGKVTKEYNSITGNIHTKGKLCKKWQNVKQQAKMKRKKHIENEAAASDSSDHLSTLSLDVSDNIWVAQDHALRDLFLYLIQKYNLEDVTNPRIKNELWKNVAKEFHQLSGGVVYVKHEKFTKKWQNWKQYNKVKGKPHPFISCGSDLDYDVIREKIRKLKERAATDPPFAAMLARESADAANEAEFAIKPATSTSERVVDTTATATATAAHGTGSVKQLEREIHLEALRCEQERYRVIVENGRLESDKLRRETQLMDLQVQMAQFELALKKQECQERGIIIH